MGAVMQFSRSAAICAILIAASAFVALAKVRVSISDSQPFTAVETQITRVADWPIPNVFTQILAVSGDGQWIARLVQSQLQGPPMYHRTVWNRREKAEVSIDPDLKMLVVHLYREPVHLHGGNVYGEDDHLTSGPNRRNARRSNRRL